MTEKEAHCGAKATVIQGVPFINNDVVNYYEVVLENLRGEYRLESQSLNLLVQRVTVIAGLGAKCYAAVIPLGSSDGALSCVAGALLSPGLSAAASNLSSGEGGLGALTLVCEEVLNYFVNNVLIGLDSENGLGKLDLANRGACHVIYCNLRHDVSSSL